MWGITMLSFEDKFRAEYRNYEVTEEVVSEQLTRYSLFVGNLFCGDSAVRDLAFKYALEDVKTGKLEIPPSIEQLELWPMRA